LSIDTFAAKKQLLRYFLKLSYRGTTFHGWQIQPNAPTVQELINEKLSLLLRKDINIVGAGRTDTGVHAKEMYAHFDYESSLDDRDSLLNRLNKMLAPDIVIDELLEVQDDAHARFDAIERAYEYHIQRKRSPFSADFATPYFFPLDIPAMQKASKQLIFKGDFSSFSKSKTQTKTNICELREAFWEEREDKLIFHVRADRFLRNMVRAIVGSLLEVGKGKMSVSEFSEMIAAKNRSMAGESVPAQGLYLTRVKYPKEIFKHGR
jgi:tRNA pseudouridine38-40 synthase